MKILEHSFYTSTRTENIILYVLGDVHVGALNCAEHELKSFINRIKNENAYWIGGGDMCDAVILSDQKRFDINTVPNWMLSGNPDRIRSNIGDLLRAQQDRFLELTDKIKDRCLGLIEGNHEYTIFKYYNRDHMSVLCNGLSTTNLTDCAVFRFRFARQSSEKKCSITTATLFITHGHGGGRTIGGELNRLERLAKDKEFNIILTGHSHTFCINPPIPMLWIPNSGKLPDSLLIKEKFVANWGSFLYTYKKGPSTYASRANYPVRPLYTVQVVISPFCRISTRHNIYNEYVKIQLNPIRL